MTIEEITQQRDDAYAALVDANFALKKAKRDLETAMSEIKLHRNEINYWSEQFKRQENTRKEPSRLEIATMLKAGPSFYSVDNAFAVADALIAAAKETK